MTERPLDAAVSETSLNNQQKVLAFAAIVEAGTGLALTVAPAVVVFLLVGAELSGVGVVLGRCFGITLVALGLACWPRGQRAGGSPAFRGMLAYNVLIALYLAYLGMSGQGRGFLLWPAAALHAAVALLLAWTWQGERWQKAIGK